MTWSEALAYARRKATERGIRYAVMGYRFRNKWKYYAVRVDSAVWQRSRQGLPHER